MMESEGWLTTEPEIGTFAIVESLSAGEFIATCSFNRSGDKVWESRHGKEYDLERIDRWIPIITPEEQRLRARVRELEGKLLVIRNAIINAPMVLTNSGILHRWSDDMVKSIDTQNGGKDGK